MVDWITKVFEKKALKDEQDSFNLDDISIQSFKSYFDSVQSMMRSQTHDINSDVLAM
jgi:hypothetical protein